MEGLRGGRSEGQRVDRMVGHLGDLTVDRLGDLTVDRLEGPRADHLVDRTVGRSEGLQVLKQVWLLEGLVVELEPFWWALEGASKLLLLLVRPEVLPP